MTTVSLVGVSAAASGPTFGAELLAGTDSLGFGFVGYIGSGGAACGALRPSSVQGKIINRCVDSAPNCLIEFLGNVPQNFFQSVRVAGPGVDVSLASSAASYSFDFFSGTSTWTWSGTTFGFAAGTAYRVDLNGISGMGLSETGGATVVPTGAESTASVGSLTVSAASDATVALTGVSATVTVGELIFAAAEQEQPQAPAVREPRRPGDLAALRRRRARLIALLSSV